MKNKEFKAVIAAIEARIEARNASNRVDEELLRSIHPDGDGGEAVTLSELFCIITSIEVERKARDISDIRHEELIALVKSNKNL